MIDDIVMALLAMGWFRYSNSPIRLSKGLRVIHLYPDHNQLDYWPHIGNIGDVRTSSLPISNEQLLALISDAEVPKA